MGSVEQRVGLSSQQSAATVRAIRLSTLLSAALACVVLLPLLGHRSLAMWDEGIYAEIAREMLHRNPLVPTWNFHPWFEKPPLLFWITAIFFRIFGVSEFWARAASAFSGVATTAVLHRFLARRFGLTAAWSSSVILLSTFGYLHACRAGETDALLALAETLALIGLIHVRENRRSGWRLFWISFAAAFMTKGAASVVLPITLLCVALVDRWRPQQFDRMFFAGLGLFLVAVLPWHLAMWHEFGSGFTGQYLGLHILARASSPIEGHYTRVWYYLFVLLVSAPPWVLLYPFSVIAVFRNAEFRSLRVFAVFALVALTFFTIVKTRLPHYIAPVYPALSALAGVYLAILIQAVRARWQSASARGCALGGVALVWAITVAVTAHPRKDLHSPRMSDGVVTPDTHEPAALLKEARNVTRADSGPLLLWSEPPIAPITTALFYSQRAVQQVELEPPTPQPAIYEYTWNPVPLAEELSTTPRLLLAERSVLARLPSDITFIPLATSTHWVLGRIAQQSSLPMQ